MTLKGRIWILFIILIKDVSLYRPHKQPIVSSPTRHKISLHQLFEHFWFIFFFDFTFGTFIFNLFWSSKSGTGWEAKRDFRLSVYWIVYVHLLIRFSCQLYLALFNEIDYSAYVLKGCHVNNGVIRVLYRVFWLLRRIIDDFIFFFWTWFNRIYRRFGTGFLFIVFILDYYRFWLLRRPSWRQISSRFRLGLL